MKNDPVVGRPEVNNSIGWGMTRVKYRIMTDADGVQWEVPETEDLRRYDPKRVEGHVYDRITITKP